MSKLWAHTQGGSEHTHMHIIHTGKEGEREAQQQNGTNVEPQRPLASTIGMAKELWRAVCLEGTGRQALTQKDARHSSKEI